MSTIDIAATNIQIRVGGHFDDLEYLALLFEDATFTDSIPGNQLQARVSKILNASADPSGPGVIFSGCRDRGFNNAFQDGGNQVGHFMTAVDMGFQPLTTANFVAQYISNPDNVRNPRVSPGQISLPWDQQVCIQLIVGHEQVEDHARLALARQAVSATRDEVWAFYTALNRIVLGRSRSLAVTRAALSSIRVGTRDGNSIMDLHLSLYGYAFGRFIRNGRITTRADGAAWLRANIA